MLTDKNIRAFKNEFNSLVKKYLNIENNCAVTVELCPNSDFSSQDKLFSIFLEEIVGDLRMKSKELIVMRDDHFLIKEKGDNEEYDIV